MTDQRARAARTAPIEANDPIDRTDAAEPIDPTARIEPTLPIERIEPFDPIDKIESSDQSDQREFMGSTLRCPHASGRRRGQSAPRARRVAA